jgi:guanosine-3',5'-bis(diphosphate) 3'-pyrophosphohydrolase
MKFAVHQDEYLHQKDSVERFLATHPRPLTEEAYKFARERHEGQKRLDDSPYIVHLIEVVYYLIICGFDDDVSLAAAFLHDGIEDGKMT